MICKKCIIRGHVQGVFYRATTQQQAGILHIKGHARNLPNGDVEVLMCGEAAAVEKLANWLWQGPEYAEVNEVKCSSVQLDEMPDHFSPGW